MFNKSKKTAKLCLSLTVLRVFHALKLQQIKSPDYIISRGNIYLLKHFHVNEQNQYSKLFGAWPVFEAGVPAIVVAFSFY